MGRRRGLLEVGFSRTPLPGLFHLPKDLIHSDNFIFYLDRWQASVLALLLVLQASSGAHKAVRPGQALQGLPGGEREGEEGEEVKYIDQSIMKIKVQ